MNQAFESFWSVYPKSPRKASKSLCLAKWEKMRLDFQATHIIKHLHWMKTQDIWLKANGAFIPAPLVYLNQMRWDGADVPDEVEKPTKDPSILKAEEDTKQAVPMPDHLKKRFDELRGRL
jgi:hypothetical protein